MEVISNFFSGCYNYIKSALASTSKKVCPSLNTVLTQFGFYFTVYLILCYIMYVLSTIFRSQLSRSKYFDSSGRRVLVVIAHPEDECMFFGPLIMRIVKSRNSVLYVLCLSCGDFDNKGQLRKRELMNSCKVLGISTENIFLCRNSQRLEGPQFMWKSDAIATLIFDYVEAFGIDTVVTFDKYGVSGHENHIALYRAVSFLCLRNWLPLTCHVYLLDSLGLMRKYSSLMDCALSVLTSNNVFVLSPYEHEAVKQAIRMHRSQLVWYRQLYMCFSRYTYVNTFYELQRFQR